MLPMRPHMAAKFGGLPYNKFLFLLMIIWHPCQNSIGRLRSINLVFIVFVVVGAAKYQFAYGRQNAKASTADIAPLGMLISWASMINSSPAVFVIVRNINLFHSRLIYSCEQEARCAAPFKRHTYKAAGGCSLTSYPRNHTYTILVVWKMTNSDTSWKISGVMMQGHQGELQEDISMSKNCETFFKSYVNKASELKCNITHTRTHACTHTQSL